MVDGRIRAELLGRGVVRRAHAGAGLGAEAAFRIEMLGEAEVGHLDAAIPREHDVAGLDVAMDDAVVMGELERVTNLRQQREHHLLCHLFAADDVHQVGAIDQLHDDEEVVRPGLAEVDDADDVRVVQLRHRLRLALEAGLKVLVPSHVPPHDLDGDGALQANLQAFIYRSHATRTEKVRDFISPGRQQLSQFVRQRQIDIAPGQRRPRSRHRDRGGVGIEIQIGGVRHAAGCLA